MPSLSPASLDDSELDNVAGGFDTVNEYDAKILSKLKATPCPFCGKPSLSLAATQMIGTSVTVVAQCADPECRRNVGCVAFTYSPAADSLSYLGVWAS